MRKFTISGLLAALMLLTACGGKPDVVETKTRLAEYVRLIIPADGIEGQTYTEVGRVEYALNQAGQIIYIESPNGPVPQIAKVHYNGTFSAPGMLQLAGIILPGMISVGGQYGLQKSCGSKCGGGSGGVVQVINDVSAVGSGTAQINGVPVH